MISYFLQPTGLINSFIYLFDMDFFYIGIRTIIKLPSNVSEELWILISTYFEKFPSHCLSLIHNLLQLNSTPGQVLEDNLTKFILQENINDYDKIKLSTVLKILASSSSFDRICTNLLTNLINSWTSIYYKYLRNLLRFFWFI
jgi:hypothetical protein